MKAKELKEILEAAEICCLCTDDRLSPLKFIRQALAALEPCDWIPVSERLPERRVKVLTIGAANKTEITEPAVAWMGEDGKTWWTYGNSSGCYKPASWQPIVLPKQPCQACGGSKRTCQKQGNCTRYMQGTCEDCPDYKPCTDCQPKPVCSECGGSGEVDMIPAGVDDGSIPPQNYPCPKCQPKPEQPEFDIVDGVGRGKGRLVEPEQPSVEFVCVECGAIDPAFIVVCQKCTKKHKAKPELIGEQDEDKSCKPCKYYNSCEWKDDNKQCTAFTEQPSGETLKKFDEYQDVVHSVLHFLQDKGFVRGTGDTCQDIKQKLFAYIEQLEAEKAELADNQHARGFRDCAAKLQPKIEQLTARIAELEKGA